MAEPYPAAGGYPGGGAGMEKPNNNLVWAIIALFGCTLLGIVALIFSLQVDSKWQTGDYAGATDAAKKAKLFAMISIILAVVGFIFWLIAVVMLGVFASSVTTFTTFTVVTR